MAFPVSPTNGQTAVVNNITYQFSNVGNTWTRILSTANIITANTLVSNGYISAVGNVSGNYILGNGSQLTGISINPSNIASGNSNVSIVSAGGNATVNIGGTSNVAVFATTGEYITCVKRKWQHHRWQSTNRWLNFSHRHTFCKWQYHSGQCQCW